MTRLAGTVVESDSVLLADELVRASDRDVIVLPVALEVPKLVVGINPSRLYWLKMPPNPYTFILQGLPQTFAPPSG